GGVRRRWATLAIEGAEGEQLLSEALADLAWVPLAALDATTRMLTALVHGGGLRRGQQATRALATLVARASQAAPTRPSTSPRPWKPPRVGLDGNCCACSAPMDSLLPRRWGLASASRLAV